MWSFYMRYGTHTGLNIALTVLGYFSISDIVLFAAVVFSGGHTHVNTYVTQ